MKASDAPPEVSFLVALHAGDDTVGNAIASALAQHDVTSEVIVVDDCSPGGTAPAACELASRHPDRVRVVCRERNGGPAAARNDAIAIARGHWVAVLDSDDTIAPGRTRAMLALAGDADAMIDNPVVLRDGAAVSMFPDTAWEALGQIDLATFARRNGLFERGFTLGYAKPMIRRSVLRRHGIRYDEALRIGEDYQLLADLLAVGARLRAVPVSGYRYHVREGSISRVLSLDHVHALRAADARHRALWPDQTASVANAIEARAASLRRAEAFLGIVDALKEGRWRDAVGLSMRCPEATRLLAIPVAARLGRLRDRIVGAPARGGSVR